MKHYSSETMRLHAQDLTKELKVKQIEAKLRYYIINEDKGKSILPMYDLASKITREWPAVGVLDLHDISQEFYCALVRAYNRVNWDIISRARNPEGALWAYLKKSIKLDVRVAVNTFKDGMRIPHYKLWEAKSKSGNMLQDFFTISMPNMWFWEKDEELGLIDDTRMTSWETEELYYALDLIMRKYLTDTERLVLEMSFGINEPKDEKRSVKYMAEFFSIKERVVIDIKARSLKKLKIDENKQYLEIFINN